MRTDLWLIAGITIFAIASLLLFGKPAACQGYCVPTPCYLDLNCDRAAGCSCFIPPGSGTGTCG